MKSYNNLTAQYNRIFKLWLATPVGAPSVEDAIYKRVIKAGEILDRYKENIYNYYGRRCADIDRNKNTPLPANIYAA